MKAIIIGAGIAGLAAAKGLQLLNWEVQVYEQAPVLKPAGAGIVLSANALKALQALGLYDAVVKKGNPLEKIEILSNKGKLISSINHSSFSQKFAHVSDISLHRGQLQQALLSQLQGYIIKDKKEVKELESLNGKKASAPSKEPTSNNPDTFKESLNYQESTGFKESTGLEIHTGKRLEHLKQTNDGVAVTFSDGETVEADLLFGCDGIHSAVREAVFPAAEKRYAGYTCWRGISEGLPASQKGYVSSESWGRGKRFGIVPLGNNCVYWFACLNAPQAKDEQMAKIGLKDLQKIFADFHNPIQEILANTPAEALLWNDMIDLKPIPTFRKNRVVLLGDAAHATTPNMGQGACQSLEDVAVLTSLLQQYDHNHDAAFREYNRLRIPRTHMVVNRSWQLGKIAHWQHPLACSFRNLLFRSLPEKFNEQQLEKLFNVDFEPINQR